VSSAFSGKAPQTCFASLWTGWKQQMYIICSLIIIISFL
jgi:hypothetical protein